MAMRWEFKIAISAVCRHGLGEAKLDPETLMDLGEIRGRTCWMMDIHTSKHRNGEASVQMEIRPGTQSGSVH
jgi:hypothetical protein